MNISIYDRLKSFIYDPVQAIGRNRGRSLCPICGYVGRFFSFGNPPRRNALCPSCGSKERHRLMQLWLDEAEIELRAARVLHVAPDPGERQVLKFADVETADLARDNVDHKVDLTATGLASESYDLVVCNHVLEHVADDRAALAEIARMLKPGGVAILMVPLAEARTETYENPAIETLYDRHRHFGQKDHLRIYGRDFEDRISATGLDVIRYLPTAKQAVRHGLGFNEALYGGRKQGGASTESS